MASEYATDEQVRESTAAAEATMTPQQVPVNVYEATGALVIVAPLPAVTPKDVTVVLKGNRLRFYAHLRSSGQREYLINEWAYGGYERELEVPDGYGAGLEASLTNGQLVVRVLRGDAVDGLTQPSGA